MRRMALTDHAAREKIRDRGENIRRLKVMQDPGKVERRDSLDTGDNEKYYRKHSGKHDSAYALEYYRRHRESTMRRLSNWREQQMAAAALSLTGARKIIDIPCGAGRFWNTILDNDQVQLLAADYNKAMVKTGMNNASPWLRDRLRALTASAFELPLKDKSVDCIFCMRLLHHIDDRQDRMNLLKEFARVSSGYVIISLWVDGNLQAYNIGRKQRDRSIKGWHRIVLSASMIETEFRQAGFSIVRHLDMLRFISKWRMYVLRV